MDLTSHPAGAMTCAEDRPFSSFRSRTESEVIWVSVSPTLSIFDRPLLQDLAKRTTVAQWQYVQEVDESCSIQRVLVMLHDYLKHRHQPVHLMGHGISGAIALLYTRRHPERVKSLTLFAVAEQPAVTWHANYYIQRHLMPCTQSCVLATVVKQLFKGQRPYPPGYLIQALQKDLEQSPLLHSLCQIETLPQGGVEVPLMVCGAEDDVVAHSTALADWQDWLQPRDRLWSCKTGGHFFHYFHPHLVGRQVSLFWRSLSQLQLAQPS